MARFADFLPRKRLLGRAALVSTITLRKAWQLRHAYNRNARQIWLFNVGDLKPLETPITWAMSLSWNVQRFTADNLNDGIGSLEIAFTV
ncbi:hypothetical protein ACJZ2D_013329 [Fusarium nematophilum]